MERGEEGETAMFWMLFVPSLLVNALLLGRAVRRSELSAEEAGSVARWAGWGRGRAAVDTMLNLATDALARCDFKAARTHAEQAIALLDAANASEAQRSYADRVLRAALWPGLRCAAPLRRTDSGAISSVVPTDHANISLGVLA